MRRRALHLAFLVVLSLLASVLVVAGLAVGPAAGAGGGTKSLDDITVNGAFGEVPTLTYEAPYATTKSVSREISLGAGEKPKKNERVSFDFSVFDGRTGEPIESSFGGSPTPSIVLDPKQSYAGLVRAIRGTPVGSRLLVALAPKEGLTERITQPGVERSDTLLFVVDVLGIRRPLVRAEGEPVTPPEGLPTVKLGGKGKPTITSPDADAPTSLVAQPLIKGNGPEVQPGQTITAHYTGVIYGTDQKFDSSWDRKTPAEFPIGTGQVITGWDEGLVGQTVGSQVLLIVPPDKGYGSTGNPQAGIKGTDTLVFVVDILDAY